MTTTAHQPRPQQRHQQEGRDVPSATLMHADHEADADKHGLHAVAALLGQGQALTAEGLPCQEHPADLWFAELPAEVEQAKALCGPCPLRDACLAGALERNEPWGVWGGQLLLRGTVVPRKRPRGRPRKDEVAA